MNQLIPLEKDDIIKAIQLYRSPRIGAVGYHKLCEICDSFDDALDVAQKRACEIGDRYYQIAPFTRAREEYEKGMELECTFLASGADGYPKLLLEDNTRPPFLWTKGRLELLHEPTIAIIGSRNPTIDGVRMTANLSKLLGYEGLTIVSGLARGIDAVAHEAALNLGTIGVVAGGLDVLYPKSNSELQNCMYEEGLVVSEMPFGHPPMAKDFPKRNRIIAGLSLAVLVIEATMRSGTKITVNDAEDLGREIMAVPGHPFAPLSALPNELIMMGARMIRNVDDILCSSTIFADLISRKHDEEQEPLAPVVTKDMSDVAAIGRAIIEGRATALPDGRVVGIDDKTR